MYLKSILATFLFALLVPVRSIHKSDVGVVDWHKPLLGIPASPLIHIDGTRGKNPEILLTWTESGVVGAVRASDGGLEWRYVLPDTESVVSVNFNKLQNEVAVLSGSGGSTLRVLSAADGVLISEKLLHENGLGVLTEPRNAGTDVLHNGDAVYTLTNGRRVTKVVNEGVEWSWDAPESSASMLYTKLIPTSQTLHVLGISKSKSTLHLTSLSLSTGQILHDAPVSSSSIQEPVPNFITVSSSTLVWLEKGSGSLKYLVLDDSITVKKLHSTAAKSSGTFSRLSPLDGLADVGIFAADSELLQLDGRAHTVSPVKFSDSLADGAHAIYAGYKTEDNGYVVGRVHHSPNHKAAIISIHSSTSSPSSQSYSFTHDILIEGPVTLLTLHPSPKSLLDAIKFTITTTTGSIRTFLLTSSSSPSLNALSWSREEGLSQPSPPSALPLFVSLPESPTVLGAASHEGESFGDRVLRHLTAILQYNIASLPARFAGSKESKAVVEVDPTTGSGAGAKALYRDAFSFRQLLVLPSSAGGGVVFGVDTKGGDIVWKKRLGGDDTKVQIIKGFVLDDTTSKIVLVGQVTSLSKATPSTVVYHLDALTGASLTNKSESGDPQDLGHELFSGPAQGAYAVPDEGLGTIIMVIDEFRQVYLYPEPSNTTLLENTLQKVSIPLLGHPSPDIPTQSTLKGHTVHAASSAGSKAKWILQPTYSLTLPLGEHVAGMQSISPSSSDPLSHPASYGKVVPQKGGGRNVLYKYINPRLLALVTSSASQDTCTLQLVDAVKGSTIYSVSLPSTSACAEVKLELVENWLVYAYYAEKNDEAGIAAAREWRVVSVEMYEGGENLVSSSLDASSYNSDPVRNMTTFERAFILPSWVGGVRSLKTTRTRRGVAGRDLILSTTSSHILSVPCKFLNPRRPPAGKKPTSEEAEEGLMPYEPVLLGEGGGAGAKRVLAHSYKVEKADHIVVQPTVLESTCLVLSYGALDMFMSRVSPSGTFDMLSEGFNKAQLILTTLGLSAAIVVVRPMVRRKRLRERWYNS